MYNTTEIKNGIIGEVEKYSLLIKQIEEILKSDDKSISKFSNVTALIKDLFDKVSWVGFYFYDGEELYLGPFQGKVACTKIKIGQGVCGKSAETKEAIIVEDVHKFDGHIACDAGCNSEIVVPIFSGEKLYGVLDLDSYSFCAFNETDKEYLEKISTLFIKYSIFEQQ